MATSVDGVTTGFGADIIIDDPMKTQDAISQPTREKVIRWFDDTLPQHLNNQAKSILQWAQPRKSMKFYASVRI